MEQIKQTMQLNEDHKPWDGATIDLEICSQAHIGEDDDSKEFGPWLKPRNRKAKFHSHGRGGKRCGRRDSRSKKAQEDNALNPNT